MQELTDVLAKATASIAYTYFHLHIDGGMPVYRERVYCYELYHQMRLLWPEGCPFVVNGEIDKAAHPRLIKLDAAYAKPDLLIHKPGDMRGNHAIIEVKASRAQNSGIQKDIKTLTLFRTAVGYARAIYLIYGDNAERLIGRVEKSAARLDRGAPIEVWLHRRVGEPAVHALTLGEAQADQAPSS